MCYALDSISRFLFGSNGTDSMHNPAQREIANETVNFGSLKSKTPIPTFSSGIVVITVASHTVI